MQIHGPRGLSNLIRHSKAAALVVTLSDDDIYSKEALLAFSDEQKSALGEFPGPVPIVRGGATSMRHVAEAAAWGCSGVLLEVDELGVEAASKLAAGAKLLGLETIAQCGASTDSVAAAASCDTGIVCVTGSRDIESMCAARKAIPKEAVAVASIERDDENREVPASKELLSSGYSAVLVKDALLGDPQDIEYAPWLLAEAMSKKSSVIHLNFRPNSRAEGGRAPSGAVPAPTSSVSSVPAVNSAAAPKAKRAAAPGGKTQVGMDNFGLDEFVGGDDDDDDF